MVALCKQVLVVEVAAAPNHVQAVQPGARVEELEVVVHPIINLQPFNSSHLQAAAHLGDELPGS